MTHDFVAVHNWQKYFCGLRVSEDVWHKVFVILQRH